MRTHKESRPDVDAMREASRLPQPSIVDIDPEDPTQVLDQDRSEEELDVEAQPADLDHPTEESEEDGETWFETLGKEAAEDPEADEELDLAATD